MSLTDLTAHPSLRRLVVAGYAVGVALLANAASAAAQPERPPDCTAADLAGIASGVAAATSAYLFTHPDVNDFYTSLHGRPDDEIPAAIQAYFQTNPQAQSDLSGIRQPLTDFRTRCRESPE
jgi:heme-binding protein